MKLKTFQTKTRSYLMSIIFFIISELMILFFIKTTNLLFIPLQLFKKGIERIELLKSKNSGPLSWICFSLPHIFKQIPRNVLKLTEFPGEVEIMLELMVLLAQSQPYWSLLLKVFNHFTLASFPDDLL